MKWESHCPLVIFHSMISLNLASKEIAGSAFKKKHKEDVLAVLVLLCRWGELVFLNDKAINMFAAMDWASDSWQRKTDGQKWRSQHISSTQVQIKIIPHRKEFLVMEGKKLQTAPLQEKRIMQEKLNSQVCRKHCVIVTNDRDFMFAMWLKVSGPP